METGTLTQLRHLTRTAVTAQLAASAPDLAAMAGVHDLVVTGDHQVRLSVDNAALDDLVRRLSAAGLLGLTCTPPTLEELFLRHYEPNPAQPDPLTVTA